MFSCPRGFVQHGIEEQRSWTMEKVLATSQWHHDANLRQRCVCLARASVKFTFLHVHAFVGSGEFSMLSHIWTKPLGCNLEPKANQGIPVYKPSVQELKRHWLLPVKLSLTKESLFCCTNNLIRRSLKFNILFKFDSVNCRSSSIINVCWSNPHKKHEGLFIATPNR